MAFINIGTYRSEIKQSQLCPFAIAQESMQQDHQHSCSAFGCSYSLAVTVGHQLYSNLPQQSLPLWLADQRNACLAGQAVGGVGC